jgi:preprotein translocase subunit YajC
MESLIQFAPFVVIFAIMYFLILRPQQQRAKQQREMVRAARRGDVIVTSGGLIGKITKSTDDSEVEVEVAPNVRVRLARSGIAEVRSKGEPVKVEAAKELPAVKKDAAR